MCIRDSGCAVGALLMLVNDPWQALWFIVLFLVLQQIEGNLIYPHVVGSSAVSYTHLRSAITAL